MLKYIACLMALVFVALGIVRQHRISPREFVITLVTIVLILS